MSDDVDYSHYRQRVVLGIGQAVDTVWLTNDPTVANPIDPNPDLCWRCDARAACDDLGLCEPCREVLR